MTSKHSLKTNIHMTFGSAALAGMLAACASSNTSSQLVDARRAYDQAAASSAPTRAPNELADARVALDRAEQAHDQDPGGEREMYLAERAARKARRAEAHSDGSLGRPALAAKSEPRRVEAVETVPAERVRMHERERDEGPRPATAKRDNAALQGLAQVANVKETPRGMVITLSGSLLFPTGEERVSAIGSQSLDQVAHALAQQPTDSTFRVEGYTDSAGSERENQQLSAKRAQAVADRLVQSGIDASRIEVEGRGEAQPIADNATDEGRATNRRVEIVVTKHPKG